MKLMIKSIIIAAVVATAPAHAVFSRLRTAVTKFNPDRIKAYTALAGLSSLNGYMFYNLATTPYPPYSLKQSVALAYKDRDFNCKEDVAEFTRMALRIEDSPTPQSKDNFWIHARALTFNYCQNKKNMSREEIYHQNISHAHDTALQWKTMKEPELAPYIVRNWDLQKWRTRHSQAYTKTAKILEHEWQEEQENNRKQEQRIKELEMLTWLHFA